jgi:hypothetical protein
MQVAANTLIYAIDKAYINIKIPAFSALSGFGGRSRADWIRTSDPYVPNVVRYRAALLPEKTFPNLHSKKQATNF